MTRWLLMVALILGTGPASAATPCAAKPGAATIVALVDALLDHAARGSQPDAYDDLLVGRCQKSKFITYADEDRLARLDGLRRLVIDPSLAGAPHASAPPTLTERREGCWIAGAYAYTCTHVVAVAGVRRMELWASRFEGRWLAVHSVYLDPASAVAARRPSPQDCPDFEPFATAADGKRTFPTTLTPRLQREPLGALWCGTRGKQTPNGVLLEEVPPTSFMGAMGLRAGDVFAHYGKLGDKSAARFTRDGSSSSLIEALLKWRPIRLHIVRDGVRERIVIE